MINRVLIALMATLFTASFAFAQTAPVKDPTKPAETKMSTKTSKKKKSTSKMGKMDDKTDKMGKTDDKTDKMGKTDDKMGKMGKMDDKMPTKTSKTSKKKKSTDKMSASKADPSSRKAGDYGDYTIDKTGKFHAGKTTKDHKKGQFIKLEDAQKMGYKGN